MLNERSIQASNQAESTVASGRGRIARAQSRMSDGFLARHLAHVAALAEAEGDLRLAGHLVDVVYQLASGE